MSTGIEQATPIDAPEIEGDRVHEVVAVVSSFRPNPDLIGAVDALLKQVERVVVVDDGSGPAADEVLSRISGERISVIRMPDNRGIAAAMNAGVQAARRSGARFVLTMDQDSHLTPGYVRTAADAIGELQGTGRRVLAVGAGTVNGVCIDSLDPRPFVPVLDTLQSGLLFDLASMADIGPFDERLFIDCVDTEYVLRGASRHFGTFRVKACAFEHSLGRQLEARLPNGRSMCFTYHSAWRRYYITRNRIEIIRRYGKGFPKWVITQGYDQARYFALTLLFGPRPLQQLLGFIVAVAHGFTSRLGPISPRLMCHLIEPVAPGRAA